MRADDRLMKLADLYKQRNALYKDNYKRFGKILVQLFPDGLHLKTEEDFNRMAIFLQVVHKITRYAQNATAGGHEDSLDDMAVYAQMLAEYDNDVAVSAAAKGGTTGPKVGPLHRTKSVWEEGDTQ
jgi:hypothetical protein